MSPSGLFSGLARARNRLNDALRRLSQSQTRADALEAAEELLWTADLGTLGAEILQKAETELKNGNIEKPEHLAQWIKKTLISNTKDAPSPLLPRTASGPTVVLFAGVNGSGKTTSLAKIAFLLQSQGHSCLVAAADTFRAGAVEQLTQWCNRLGAPIVTGNPKEDPASIAHKAATHAQEIDIDYLLIDTAGRLQNSNNLMDELAKLARVIGKQIPQAPHHSLLTLDATIGQNALSQVREFSEALPLTGIVLTKLDGSTKGGAALAVHQITNLPVLLVGIGEKEADMVTFNAENFVTALLGEA